MSVQAPHPPNVDPDQAHAEANPTEEQQRLDALVLDVYGHMPVRRTAPRKPRHPCTCCGRRTMRPDRCRTCESTS